MNQKNQLNSCATPNKFSAVLDEDYLMVDNQVDEITRKKIINGEYVDFSKLMPRDKIFLEEDNHMEMVNKGRGVLLDPFG